MGGIKLDLLLLDIPGIGPRFLERLKKLGIKTVRDLLWHLPTRYEDFSQIYPISDIEPGEQVTIRGMVEDVSIRRSWRRNMTIVEALIRDDSGSIKAIWFNQPYVANTLRVGRTANFAGKISVSEENELYLSHPAYEIVHGDPELEETRHTARLVPVYPETRGLTSKGLRFLVQPILKNLETLKEWLPQEVLQENQFPDLDHAIKTIHFPKKVDDALLAKKRFVFEDLFLLQLSNLEEKLKLARDKAPAIKADIAELKKIIAELPFELTFSQKRSLWEIIQDLEQPHPMNRLLQGDVGSGKTVVAAIAALIAAENGFQTAFMAPTEVLARQHFATLKKLFLKIGRTSQPSMGLLTSSESKIFYDTDLEAEIGKTELREKIGAGEIKIVIGTHALIEESVSFKKLGLVVIDEQHRFGVRQRAKLVASTKTEQAAADTDKAVVMEKPASSQRKSQLLAPHFLSMSATPIPRTLMLTIFGDLDISTITELPAGRKEIVTKIVPPNERAESYEFIRSEVKSGRQVFVICPRIEKSETGANASETSTNKRSKSAILWEVKSVKEEYEKLSKKIFPDLRVAMLHGQMKSKEKESVMKGFSSGDTNILVSTSVIEVGVDIQNATIMMIEGADRFGLAQLYQFRGRVGRGEHQSYCLLFTDSSAKTTRDRLAAIMEAKNGFELAERDLKLRGPGEFLGSAQTGFPDTVMSGLQNIELVKASREAASNVLKRDPNMKKHAPLRARLALFKKDIHQE